MSRKPSRKTGRPQSGRPQSGRPKGNKGKSRTRRGQRSRTGRVLVFLRWAAVAAIWGVVVLAAAIGWYAWDLPEIDDLSGPTRRPSITLVAADGAPIASYGDLYGAPVTAKSLPPHLIWAVLAAEDRRFYKHSGIDFLGLARAMYINLREGRVRQGGSTLTQQLAKNLFLTPERTIDRKIREAVLAVRLESRFSKDQILTIYLNRVYLGAGAWGVDAAARRFFGKPAARLNLYESAMLAGLLKAPSRYNPARSAKRAHRRTLTVLDTMVDAGFIKPKTAAQAKKMRRKTPSDGGGAGGRYFADWILDQVRSHIGYSGRDLTVHTTLLPRLQAAAERKTNALLAAEAARTRAGQAALVAMAPDGAVRAMVGGGAYDKSQFNRATQALRQPGSAFKPVVFLAALEAGLRPDDRFLDAPVKVGRWRPRNYNDRYFGTVTMGEAMRRSLNSVAVRISERVGRGRVRDTAKRLGITSKLRAEPSIALGVSEVSLIEMTAAYAVFANGGTGVWPYGVNEIRDRAGRVLYRRRGSGPGRAVAAKHVRDMNGLLRAVVAGGTGRAARIDRPAAGKTGTSQDFRDAWFIGYTAELVAGVWIGNDNGSPMNEVTGGGLPARLWQAFMADAHKGTAPRALNLTD